MAPPTVEAQLMEKTVIFSFFKQNAMFWVFWSHAVFLLWEEQHKMYNLLIHIKNFDLHRSFQTSFFLKKYKNEIGSEQDS